MTPGRLRKTWPDGTAWEARIGPEGWSSDNPVLLHHLMTLYPPGGTPAGVPWVRAFYDAVEGLGADTVEAPVPDPLPEGVMA